MARASLALPIVVAGESTKGQVRVLHVITDAGPHPYFEHFGAHTDRERFDVRIATVGPAGALHADAERMGLASYALGARRRSQYPRAVMQLTRLLHRERIDVVQAHLFDGTCVGLAAARFARTPVAVFTGHHSHEMPLHNRRLLTAVDRLCARRLSDAVISPSVQLRDTFVQFHGVRAAKIEVIHHGFDLAELDPTTADAAAVRAELGLAERTVITAVGRLYWIKNQQALVRAFERATSESPAATLLIAGGGDPRPLGELVRSLGLADRVRLLGPRNDVPSVLAASDLFVQPALAESFGMVVVEAMAMGCPVVSTPVGIAPEVVTDGPSGVLARDGSVGALTEALVDALAARDRWREWGSAARAVALSFRADEMVRAYEALYLDLLRSSKHHAGR